MWKIFHETILFYSYIFNLKIFFINFTLINNPRIVGRIIIIIIHKKILRNNNHVDLKLTSRTRSKVQIFCGRRKERICFHGDSLSKWYALFRAYYYMLHQFHWIEFCMLTPSFFCFQTDLLLTRAPAEKFFLYVWYCGLCKRDYLPFRLLLFRH